MYRLAFAILSLLVFSTAAHALGQDDNLAAWEKASASERAALAKLLVSNFPKPGGREKTFADTRFLINCLLDLARNGGEKETVKSAATACWESLK